MRENLLRTTILACALGFTIYFALFARFLPTDVPEYIRGNGDHNLHILAFFCLTILLLLGFRSTKHLVQLVLFAALVAVALETIQIWLPDRGANLDDLVASLTGVGLGFITAIAVHTIKLWLRRTKR